MATKTKSIQLDPQKKPAPKQARLSPGAADRVMEKADRLMKGKC